MGGLVMDALAFPIFVAEGLDIRIFQSIEDAERSLEPWWVEENLGKVYDAQGRLLRLQTGDKRVRILSWEAEPAHAGELKALLREFLKATNNSERFAQHCDLPCLVEACQKFIKT
jgi:hypothetical protein